MVYAYVFQAGSDERNVQEMNVRYVSN